MVEPLTVVALAFSTLKAVANSEPGKKFVEGVIGKVAENFTEGSLKKAGELRQAIVDKLRGNSEAVQALKDVKETGSETALRDVADYLNVAMRKDETFARQVQQLTQEIHQTLVRFDDVNGRNVQQILGGTGQQFNNEKIDAPVQQGTITNHNYYGTPPQD
ncbi:MAG: hypothetical protein WA882_21885 [Geitlerinemataceae cyanobacterium]